MSRNAFLGIFVMLMVVALTEGLMRHPSKSRGIDAANQSEEEPDRWEREFVSVRANGEIRRSHLNPALSGNADDIIGIIPDRRIISGTEANRGDIPYQVSMQLHGTHMCGGTIYNSKTIITAAHCFMSRGKIFEDYIIENVAFVAGALDISKYEKGEQVASVKDVILHPNYIYRTGINDIAVIRLKTSYMYNKYVQPLPIDHPPVVPEKVIWAWISGWGYTKKKRLNEAHEDAYWPDVLRKALIEVFPKRECLSIYMNYPSNYMVRRLQNGAICAGERPKNGETQAKDACQADSGGPLACINPNMRNRRFLCGIVSTGIGCGVPGLPGIYTRVADYQNWIIRVAGYDDKRTF